MKSCLICFKKTSYLNYGKNICATCKSIYTSEWKNLILQQKTRLFSIYDNYLLEAGRSENYDQIHNQARNLTIECVLDYLKFQLKCHRGSVYNQLENYCQAVNIKGCKTCKFRTLLRSDEIFFVEKYLI